MLSKQVVTGCVDDADEGSLWRVADGIQRAMHACGHSSDAFVASAVAELAHADLRHIPKVFSFLYYPAYEWANPGMVAGAIRDCASVIAKSSYFRLWAKDDDERLVRVSDFIAEAEARRQHWIRELKMGSHASWSKIRARARVMWRRRKGAEALLLALFEEGQLYDMDFEYR